MSKVCLNKHSSTTITNVSQKHLDYLQGQDDVLLYIFNKAEKYHSMLKHTDTNRSNTEDPVLLFNEISLCDDFLSFLVISRLVTMNQPGMPNLSSNLGILCDLSILMISAFSLLSTFQAIMLKISRVLLSILYMIHYYVKYTLSICILYIIMSILYN